MWDIYSIGWIQVCKYFWCIWPLEGVNRAEGRPLSDESTKLHTCLFPQSKGSLELPGVVGEPEVFSTARLKFRACCVFRRNHPPGAGLTIITGMCVAWLRQPAAHSAADSSSWQMWQITAHRRSPEQQKRLDLSCHAGACGAQSARQHASDGFIMGIRRWPWQGINCLIQAAAHKGLGN